MDFRRFQIHLNEYKINLKEKITWHCAIGLNLAHPQIGARGRSLLGPLGRPSTMAWHGPRLTWTSGAHRALTTPRAWPRRLGGEGVSGSLVDEKSLEQS
jgi:hypothetical protein